MTFIFAGHGLKAAGGVERDVAGRGDLHCCTRSKIIRGRDPGDKIAW